MEVLLNKYRSNLIEVFQKADIQRMNILAESLLEVWQNKKQVFLCGNGGSAANAMHIANDFFYGTAKDFGNGIRVNALSSNQSVLTCLANDVSYDDIFSRQLRVLGQAGDMLIALSGSGNSANIIKAIETAKELDIKTFAILGYSGGKCLNLADVPIHFPIDDMQIAEDMQLIVGHMIMQWLRGKMFFST
ncbi:MAG: SIS domain-containing protein [Nitrospirae bacterium]|nr:SIS domain-containing protein [Nitrospirota bacterium]